MLVNETNISQKVTVELEKDIAATLDTKVNDLNSGRVEIYQYYLFHSLDTVDTFISKRGLRESQEAYIVSIDHQIVK